MVWFVRWFWGVVVFVVVGVLYVKVTFEALKKLGCDV
jgi:hypothetical protein